MIQFKINEAQTFQFDMEIDGKINKVEHVSFVIESGSGYDIKVPARYKAEQRLIECDIPILEGIITDGEKNIRLEMVVDGKFYVPLQDKIIIETPVRIVSKMIGEPVKEIKEDNISVRIVSKPLSTPKMVSEVAKEIKDDKIMDEDTIDKLTKDKMLVNTPTQDTKKNKNKSFTLWMNK